MSRSSRTRPGSIEANRRCSRTPGPTWHRQRFSHWWLRFRVLPGVDEQTRASNAAAALFYALPLAVLLSAAWLPRYLPDPVTSRRLALFALAGVTTALGLMRSPYDVRAVDNVVIPAILCGCCVAALWNAAARTGVAGRWLLRIATGVLALLVVKSVAVAGQFGDRVSYLAGDWHSIARARGAWADVQARLTAQPPLKYWEERDAPVQIRLAQYAGECVPRSRRLLVLWAAPEIYYYADQLMASRHLFFDAGYEKLPVEERLALEKIRRFSPPLVFATGSLEAFTRQMYPGVVDYVGRNYEPVDAIEEEGVRYIILLKRNEPVARPYGEHHWPCMACNRMSILERLNPLRVIRAADSVSRLQDLGDKLREDQKAMARQLRAISRQLEQLDQTLKRQEDVLASLPASARRGSAVPDVVQDRRAARGPAAGASRLVGRRQSSRPHMRRRRSRAPRSSSIRFHTS